MPSKSHGMTREKIYYVWAGMKRRCYNPATKDYERYGGRGITVCAEWKQDFKAFHKWAINNGYQEGLTLERKDVNDNYRPENCCWIPKADQSRNRRSNLLISYNGETKILSEWADLYGINRNTLHHRIFDYGWSIDEALNTPAKVGRNQYSEV